MTDNTIDLKVGGLMEDIEEPLVENGTHKTQEPQESGSNYTDLDDASWEMSPQEIEREVIQPSNQQDGGRLVCTSLPKWVRFFGLWSDFGPK